MALELSREEQDEVNSSNTIDPLWGLGRASDLAASRIVELNKRVKTLVAEKELLKSGFVRYVCTQCMERSDSSRPMSRLKEDEEKLTNEMEDHTKTVPDILITDCVLGSSNSLESFTSNNLSEPSEEIPTVSVVPSDFLTLSSNSLKMEEKCKLLEELLQRKSMEVNQLETVLNDKHGRLLWLEEKLKNQENSGNVGQDNHSQSTSTSAGLNPTCQDTLGVAERSRLLELLNVTNRKLAEQNRLTKNLQENLRQERFRAVFLETKLAKHELERASLKNEPCGGKKKTSTTSKCLRFTNYELKGRELATWTK